MPTLLSIPEVVLLEPRVFADDRGQFFESYSQREFEAAFGSRRSFVQDNQSVSRRGVLRGLHYQLAPHAQGKLVRVCRGRIFDVAIDIRASSPTFGRWTGAELSAENRRQLWIPEGFAHGFVALEEETTVLYKSTQYYAPLSERSILWSDSEIGIAWPSVGRFIVSAKDAAAPMLRQAELD